MITQHYDTVPACFITQNLTQIRGILDHIMTKRLRIWQSNSKIMWQINIMTWRLSVCRWCVNDTPKYWPLPTSDGNVKGQVQYVSLTRLYIFVLTNNLGHLSRSSGHGFQEEIFNRGRSDQVNLYLEQARSINIIAAEHDGNFSLHGSQDLVLCRLILTHW